MKNIKRQIALWILHDCDSTLEEIEHLLDRAYPIGSNLVDMYSDIPVIRKMVESDEAQLEEREPF